MSETRCAGRCPAATATAPATWASAPLPCCTCRTFAIRRRSSRAASSLASAWLAFIRRTPSRRTNGRRAVDPPGRDRRDPPPAPAPARRDAPRRCGSRCSPSCAGCPCASSSGVVALGGVLADLALRVWYADVRDGLPLGVGVDEFDPARADRRASGWRGRRPSARRAAHVHLQDRRRLGVRLVVGVLTLDADDVAEVLAGPVTGAADLDAPDAGRPHAGNRPRVAARDDVIQLPHAVQLVVDERACAFADVALHARDLRVRRVLPRGELRMHRRVARLAAERRRLHRSAASRSRRAARSRC